MGKRKQFVIATEDMNEVHKLAGDRDEIDEEILNSFRLDKLRERAELKAMTREERKEKRAKDKKEWIENVIKNEYPVDTLDIVEAYRQVKSMILSQNKQSALK
jgi:hypothetical protein